jgi:hypothetical protein
MKTSYFNCAIVIVAVATGFKCRTTGLGHSIHQSIKLGNIYITKMCIKKGVHIEEMSDIYREVSVNDT